MLRNSMEILFCKLSFDDTIYDESLDLSFNIYLLFSINFINRKKKEKEDALLALCHCQLYF